jgi:Concanavalin A-like lectin/glucanases superfamily
MYVDGVPIGSVTLTSPLATSGTSLAIGTYFLTGSLADLAIYPTALSPATIAAHFTDSGVTREDN